MRDLLIPCLIIALGATGSYLLQTKLDASLDRSPEVQMRYLLQAENLERISLGYPQVTADFIWIKSIQFYHQQFLKRLAGEEKVETEYRWLIEISDLVTDLNPNFQDAYYYYGLYLGGAELESLGRFDHEHSDAIRLLQKGIDNNPHSWFLLDTLAERYTQLHERLSEGAGSGVISEERRAELLPEYRQRALELSERAAALPDAPPYVKLGVSGRNKRLAGDDCTAAEMMTTAYARFSQDFEREQHLWPMLFAIERCNEQQIEQGLEALGAAPALRTFGELVQLGVADPTRHRCPWPFFDAHKESGDRPPEDYVDLFARDLPLHPYEYFSSPWGEVISWKDGARRQLAQTTASGEIAKMFYARYHVHLRDCRAMQAVVGGTIHPSPYGRDYLYDPITETAFPAIDRAGLTWLVGEFVRATDGADRREALTTLLRAQDADTAAQLDGLRQDWAARNPGQNVPALEQLLGGAVPPSPLRLLMALADFEDEALPTTVQELQARQAELPVPGQPDYLVTPEGKVMSRPVAGAFHAELHAFLQAQLDGFYEDYGHPPTFFSDLYDYLPFPFPQSPFGTSPAIDEGSRSIIWN